MVISGRSKVEAEWTRTDKWGNSFLCRLNFSLRSLSADKHLHQEFHKLFLLVTNSAVFNYVHILHIFINQLLLLYLLCPFFFLFRHKFSLLYTQFDARWIQFFPLDIKKKIIFLCFPAANSLRLLMICFHFEILWILHPFDSAFSAVRFRASLVQLKGSFVAL